MMKKLKCQFKANTIHGSIVLIPFVQLEYRPYGTYFAISIFFLKYAAGVRFYRRPI